MKVCTLSDIGLSFSLSSEAVACLKKLRKQLRSYVASQLSRQASREAEFFSAAIDFLPSDIYFEGNFGYGGGFGKRKAKKGNGWSFVCNAMFVNMYRMDDASNESLEVMDKDKEKDRKKKELGGG